MLKTVLRISVMYLSSVVIMRAAGKKEVSQLELSELVTSFMVSEIACMPITDPEVPIYKAIVYSATVIAVNLILSKLSIRIPIIKHMVAGKPQFLIVKGKINKNEMYKAQVTLSELISAMRREGVCSIDKINYAVLESDGNISIIADEKEDDEGESGLQHMLVIDGRINKSELEMFGYNEKWLLKRIRAHGKNSPEEVFFFGVDDAGNEVLIE